LRSSPRSATRSLIIAARLAVALAAASVIGLPLAQPALAAGITLEARTQLGGHVRPGSWAEVNINVANDGPTIEGAELRVRSQVEGRSQFGVAVSLPAGARQEHRLYAQTPLFGTKLIVDLVAADQVIATTEVRIISHDVYSPVVGIVAERPEGFQRDVADASQNPNFNTTTVVALTVADLPHRVEAWAALDRLIWQDASSAALDRDQLEALQLWLGAGGRLVVLGGTTGAAALRGFPAELLPFAPERTVDVPLSDLRSFLGSLPLDAASSPALVGTLRRGTVLGRTGDHVYAAQAPWGQGTVTVVGLNPAERWLARTNTAGTLWRRLLPASTGSVISPLILADDSAFLYGLQNLPAVALPPIEQLFVLLIAYTALIGPINYLVLRRLDRREWAWLTMPALVGIFAVVSYGMGAALKGSDVIVNQLAIVRSGQGTGQGIAQAYVGIFSPSRRTFDVRLPGGALLSSTISQLNSTEQPLDVLFGDPTRLRNFEVGFGLLRGFRAETETSAPVIDANLSLSRGRVTGLVVNRSELTLEHVAVVFAGGVATTPELGPGQSWTVDIPASDAVFNWALADRIFGSSFPRDPAEQRTFYTRRSLIEQLSGYGSRLSGAPLDVPLLLSWHRGPAVPVDLAGERPNQVGDSLYMTALNLTLDTQAVFHDPLVIKTIIDNATDMFWADGSTYNMGRGTVVVELRPAGVTGTFRATSLELALTNGGIVTLRGNGQAIEPLPDGEQPDQDDPLGNDPTKPGDDPGQPGDDPGIPQPGDPTGPGGGQVPGRPGDPAKPEPMPWEPGWEPTPDIQLFDFGAPGGHDRMSVALRTHALTKRYGRSLAVAGVDLEIASGEIFGLVGPNGAGKTTTLKMLATLLSPSAGDAEIAGHSVRREPDAVRNVIGYMPDTFGVYDDMRVWEYLDFFGRCYGLSAARRRQMISDLLELVDLADKRDAYVQDLSRGMQQRLCLAHALVHDPQVLLLDEPASGLDPRARVELRELLRELRALGKTIVISSHILPELEELCTSWRSSTTGGCWPAAASKTSPSASAGGVLPRVGCSATRAAGAAGAVPGRQPAVASVVRALAVSSSPCTATTRAAAVLARHGPRRVSGWPASRPRPATSRSCSSRSPTCPARRSPGNQEERGVSVLACRGGASGVGGGLSRFSTGISAVSIKELRGRMRGPARVRRRHRLPAAAQRASPSPSTLPAPAGRNPDNSGVFPGPRRTGVGSRACRPGPARHCRRASATASSAACSVETLLVLVLAPAFTTGAISLEREKQTLDMLVTTPLSTLGMVIGKLFSALTYVFLLILASIPLASLVFVFGGVGPEDLVRGYVFLFALAFGMGAIGLFISALVRRTQTATVITFVTVLVLSIGTAGMHEFWSVATTGPPAEPHRHAARTQAPEALLWLNPFVGRPGPGLRHRPDTYHRVVRVHQQRHRPAVLRHPVYAGDGDITARIAAAEVRAEAGGCLRRRRRAGRSTSDVAPEPVPAATVSLGFPRDTFWPKSAAAFFLVVLASAQLSRRVGVAPAPSATGITGGRHGRLLHRPRPHHRPRRPRHSVQPPPPNRRTDE
jgi:ABC-type Na+ transport system ATPase subunit NatA